MRQYCWIFIFLLIALNADASPLPPKSAGRGDVERAITRLSSFGFEDKKRASDELTRIGEPAVVPLVSLLKAEAEDTRWWAALTLGKIKSPVAVPPLIAALGDRDWLVRFFAAWSLGEIRDFRAVEPLIAALEDAEFLVVKMALDSLREITGKNFGEAQLPWKVWWEHEGQVSGK